MRVLSILLGLLTTGVLVLPTAAFGQSSTSPEVDADAVFFEALDLKMAGDCDGAVARFQLAFSQDPSLAQALLHLAECFQDLGMHDEAIDEAQSYLDSEFELAEVERAQALILQSEQELGVQPALEEATAVESETEADPDGAVVPSEQTAGSAEGSDAAAATTASPVESPGRQTATWSTVSIEAGALVEHHANSASLTAGGPVLAFRVLPWRYIEIAAQAQIEFGSHLEDPVYLPGFALSAAGSIPVGRLRILFGAQLPMALSSVGGGTRLDVGVGGEVDLRIALGRGPFVLGAHVGAGHLVKPYVGGSIRFGVQFGGQR